MAANCCGTSNWREKVRNQSNHGSIWIEVEAKLSLFILRIKGSLKQDISDSIAEAGVGMVVGVQE